MAGRFVCEVDEKENYRRWTRRKWTVDTIELQTGEQLPLLKLSNGPPLWHSTIFALTELRAKNLAVNTILQAIRAIKFGEQLPDHLSIDLGLRLGLTHVLNPLSFIEFKKWMAAQPQRSRRQIEQDRQQVDFVEQLIADGLLSSTYDTYY